MTYSTKRALCVLKLTHVGFLRVGNHYSLNYLKVYTYQQVYNSTAQYAKPTKEDEYFVNVANTFEYQFTCPFCSKLYTTLHRNRTMHRRQMISNKPSSCICMLRYSRLPLSVLLQQETYKKYETPAATAEANM